MIGTGRGCEIQPLFWIMWDLKYWRLSARITPGLLLTMQIPQYPDIRLRIHILHTNICTINTKSIVIGNACQCKARYGMLVYNVKRAREQECTKKVVKKIKWPPRIVHCIQIEYKYKLAKNQGVFIVPRGNLTFAF